MTRRVWTIMIILCFLKSKICNMPLFVINPKVDILHGQDLTMYSVGGPVGMVIKYE